MKTPSSKWATEGRPDPHGDYYKKPLADMAGGSWTTGQVARSATSGGLDSIASLTVLKHRIRWLSRRVSDTAERRAERAGMPYGDLTDDELANEAFIHEKISCITAAVLRMFWLENCLLDELNHFYKGHS